VARTRSTKVLRLGAPGARSDPGAALTTSFPVADMSRRSGAIAWRWRVSSPTPSVCRDVSEDALPSPRANLAGVLAPPGCGWSPSLFADALPKRCAAGCGSWCRTRRPSPITGRHLPAYVADLEPPRPTMYTLVSGPSVREAIEAILAGARDCSIPRRRARR